MQREEMTTLHGLFQTAAENHKENIAVQYFKDEFHYLSITYQELFTCAQVIKTFLRSEIAECRTPVGILLGPGVFLPAVIVGILESGLQFSPINPLSPITVLSNYLQSAKIKYVITQKSFIAKLYNISSNWRIFHLPNFEGNFSLRLLLVVNGSCFKDSKNTIYETSNIAYTLCTSGTTGAPKSVIVPHSCIVPNIVHLRKLFLISSIDCVSMLSPLTFDPCIVEMFLALSTGAKLVLINDAIKIQPGKLLQILFKVAKVSVFHATPSLLYTFSTDDLKKIVFQSESSLRVLSIGGENCPGYHTINSWLNPDVYPIISQFSFYNLYGVTEVSVWSTYFKLPYEKILSKSKEQIPLGYPLLSTSLLILPLDTESSTVCQIDACTKGDKTNYNIQLAGNSNIEKKMDTSMFEIKRGFLYLGGKLRHCNIEANNMSEGNQEIQTACAVLDNKFAPTENNCHYHNSGDVVSLTVNLNSKNKFMLNYLGRMDAQIKRNGKRMNLLYLKVILQNLSIVHAAYAMMCMVQSTEEPKVLVCFVVLKMHFNLDKEKCLSYIHKHLRNSVESYCVPDSIIVVNELPLTQNGKVDDQKLHNIFVLRKVCCPNEMFGFDDKGQTISKLQVQNTLQMLWQHTINSHQFVLNDKTKICPSISEDYTDQNFISAGGDSLKAVHFVSLIQHILPLTTTPTNLLSILLDGSFIQVLNYILGLMPNNHHGKEKCNSLSTNLISEKKTVELSKIILPKYQYISLRRGGNTFYHNCIMQKENLNILSKDTSLCIQNCDWSYSTGQCVDSSPLVVLFQNSLSHVVIAGSHSCRLSCLNIATGTTIWETNLENRIESSACLTPCGNFVAVGCYDHSIYFLKLETGKVVWRFATNGLVKSSPCPGISNSSQVCVGSYDGNLYCLDASAQVVYWQYNCGRPGIFSSPCLHVCMKNILHHPVVYIANLAGHMFSLNYNTGNMRWSLDLCKPIFSSPASCDLGVIVGCVDTKFYMLSHQDGSVLWSFCTGQAIFSSPAISKMNCSSLEHTYVVTIGSHDGYTYCLNAKSGKEIWRFCPSVKNKFPVYSTPYPFCVGLNSKNTKTLWLVLSVSTDGTVALIDMTNGQLLAEKSLPGQVFSSPVFINEELNNLLGRIIIGCRDNNIYSLKLTEKTTSPLLEKSTV